MRCESKDDYHHQHQPFFSYLQPNQQNELNMTFINNDKVSYNFFNENFVNSPPTPEQRLGNMRMVKAKMGIFLIRKHHTLMKLM